MDIFTLDTVSGANEGADFTPKHPVTGESLDFSIRLMGSDSDTFQRISKAQQNKKLKYLSKTGRLSMTAEENEESAIKMLAACTVSWTKLEYQGEDFPFSTENAETIYAALPWLREQVDGFIGDRENFMKPSVKKSKRSRSKSSD